RVTSSWEGSISGCRTISPSVKSASLRLAATRSRSDRAAMPANWSPDFSSLALANSSRRSEKSNRSIMTWCPSRKHHVTEKVLIDLLQFVQAGSMVAAKSRLQQMLKWHVLSVLADEV